MPEGTEPRISVPAAERAPARLLADLIGRIESQSTSFHVALDTMDARRLRADPNLVSIPGFLLLDTSDYEPVLGLVPLHLFWRMQGMDILAHTRAANRQRRARPRHLPTSGSVWLVDATLDLRQPEAPSKKRTPPSLRISALHALDRVTIERGGPRLIERLDTLSMLPRFTENN
jgi:hypothetical protein